MRKRRKTKEITEFTPQRELPARMTATQVANLDDETEYPTYFYHRVLGLKTQRIWLNDYRNGVIDPRKIRFTRAGNPFHTQGRGQQYNAFIKGEELKRIFGDQSRHLGNYRLLLKSQWGQAYKDWMAQQEGAAV